MAESSDAKACVRWQPGARRRLGAGLGGRDVVQGRRTGAEVAGEQADDRRASPRPARPCVRVPDRSRPSR